jgi:hypothetical protein
MLLCKLATPSVYITRRCECPFKVWKISTQLSIAASTKQSSFTKTTDESFLNDSIIMLFENLSITN